MRFPDNPTEVSVDFLARLDRSPGEYVGSEKLTGRRRIVHFDDGTYTVQAKHGHDRVLLPPVLIGMIEKIRAVVGDGLSIDCEWVGNKSDGALILPEHGLYGLDVLRYDGKWLDKVPYAERILLQGDIAMPWVTRYTSPDLVEAFYAQLTNPISEGLVVRHVTQKNICRDGRCATAPLMFKVKHRVVNRILQYVKGDA